MMAREFLNLPAKYPLSTSDVICTSELGMSRSVVWSWLNPNPLIMIDEKLETTPLGICAAIDAKKRM
jgi:hypothetical protein